MPDPIRGVSAATGDPAATGGTVFEALEVVGWALGVLLGAVPPPDVVPPPVFVLRVPLVVPDPGPFEALRVCGVPLGVAGDLLGWWWLDELVRVTPISSAQ